ncbi:MAG: SMP-30/gluconolactonase/LRE family protein [Pyrinomonadaceae bacterium]
MKKIVFKTTLIGFLLLAAFLVYVGFFGWNIKAVAYEPPEIIEFAGALAPNERLAGAEIFGKGKVLGGEDVAVDSQGRIYTGSVVDGKIYRISPNDNNRIEEFADLGRMPVGLKFDASGNLIVCHNPKGLLSIGTDGKMTVLTDSAEDVPFGFTDDLDIASDGKIYFSDATTKFTGNKGNLSWEYEIMEAKPYGRLLVYDPETRQTKVLLRDLYFANGVSLSKNEDFVVVLETYRFRVVRYWLRGEKAGSWDYLNENLPGYPDGLMQNGRGEFWIAIPTKRNALADFFQPKPFFKNIITVLPKSWWVRPEPYGLVIKMDENGQILESLHDPSGNLSFITNAVEQRGFLYLATLKGDWIARVKLAE